jgi:hypothetical protein
LFGSLLEADVEVTYKEGDGGGVWFVLGLVVNEVLGIDGTRVATFDRKIT